MVDKVRLGKTGLMVSRIAMGCIPIQRRTHEDAVDLIRYALDAGVNFFDTAHVYGDSEEKLGDALSGGRRDGAVIATKVMGDSYEETVRQLETSLRRLRTDYIDLYQWHNPGNLDDFRNGGVYRAMLEAQQAGKVRFLGMTNHHADRANLAIDSGAFATLQFPLSVLSAPEELAISYKCVEHDMGFIAMKAMCGGMLEDGRLPFVFLNQYPHIVPIWGLEKREELDQFLRLARHPEPFTDAMRAEVAALRREYGDEYCRGCGYCLPCPAGIDISILMRIVAFNKRTRQGDLFTDSWKAKVDKIDDCVHCRACVDRCPYHLEAPDQLKRQQAEYRRLYQAYKAGS